MNECLHQFGDIRQSDGKVFRGYRKLPSGRIREEWTTPEGFVRILASLPPRRRAARAKRIASAPEAKSTRAALSRHLGLSPAKLASLNPNKRKREGGRVPRAEYTVGQYVYTATQEEFPDPPAPWEKCGTDGRFIIWRHPTQ